MAQESSAVEQAVSRALRDNLAALERTANELRQAMDDLVSACSSSKPTNALPAMLRAQTAAASLAAGLEVAARFVTSSLVPPARTPLEEAVMRSVSIPAPEPPPPPPPRIPPPMAEEAAPRRATVEPPPPPPPPAIEPPPPPPPPVVEAQPEPEPEPEPAPVAVAPPPRVEAPVFDVKSLPGDEQELHRRANRHAKVTMQDIKLIRPDKVREGRENRDLCVRLKDDIDKARKEYERRFKPILGHPVDYFYDWMVQILADGDPEKLGEYPYPSPVHRR